MKDKRIIISVVMSTYNPEKKYLEQSLKSILGQSYSEFEIILVDDGSTIDIPLLIRECGINDNRINYYKLEKNMGLTFALNYGIRKSKGKYIARMDDDDLSMQDRLKKQVSYLEDNEECVVCFSGMEVINKNSDVIRTVIHKIKQKSLINRLLIRGNCFTHSSAIIKKEAFVSVNGYDEKLYYSQDYDLWMRLIQIGEIGYIQEPLVQWRDIGNEKSLEKEALQTAYCFYTKYLYLLNNKEKTSAKFIFVIEQLYSIYQVLYKKMRQFK